MPTKSLKEIEEAMKLADKYTIEQIIDYLKLDEYLIVSNSWSQATPETAKSMVDFVNWAKFRIKAWIKTFEDMNKRIISTHNRTETQKQRLKNWDNSKINAH